MMQQPPGREGACAALSARIDAWRKGTGGVVLVSAEAGMGKTMLLNWVESTLAADAVGSAVRVDCRPSIGAINTSAIQPLQPFGVAIDKLFLQSGQAARKRLALNIGMSVLASIPIAGDLFYAVKAISQDVNEYKRDTAALHEKKRSAVSECVSTLRTLAEKSPFVLLVDDAQWSDSQSVEVVRQLATALTSTPLLIIWAVSPTIVQRSNLALATLMRTEEIRASTVHLEPVDLHHVLPIIQAIIPSAVVPDNIIATIFERSGGNPGIITEYVKFIQGAGHLRPDGSFDERAFDSVRLVSSEHPATDVILRDISEEDSVTLSLCASEGQEFTAFLQAALTNTDVLSTIRTLRRLQTSTGLIRSIGARTRYGVKSTAFEFVQSFPFTFFLHRPEYEERKDIHQRIAEILSREYEATQIEELRGQLAVHVAAHSAEAGDNTAVERMLVTAAVEAELHGAPEIASYINAEILPLYAGALFGQPSDDGNHTIGVEHSTETDDESSSRAHQPIGVVVREISDAIIQGRASDARVIAIRVLETHSGLSRHERVLLTCLASRACIELSMLEDAEALMRPISTLSDISPSDHCLMKNIEGAIALARGNSDLAAAHLHEAARLAEQLPVHVRVMTLGNIIVHLRAIGDISVDRYENTVRRLASVHGWPGVRTDLGL
ncbi:MAG: AAA family ATPase [Candidatus Kapabacteria bacterium]|nr:AAA family ATPase [Candidatus Kapabacteria bacterium]